MIINNISPTRYDGIDRPDTESSYPRFLADGNRHHGTDKCGEFAIEAYSFILIIYRNLLKYIIKIFE